MKMSSYVRRTRTPAQPGGAGEPLARPGDTCDVDVVHLDAVQTARAALPDETGLLRMVDVLALLSNPTRLKIVMGLRAGSKKGRRGELCVCDLAVVAGASKSMTSHQLRLLRAAGLVVPRRAGKLTYYRLADTSLVASLDAAMHVGQKRREVAASAG